MSKKANLLERAEAIDAIIDQSPDAWTDREKLQIVQILTVVASMFRAQASTFDD